MGDYQFTRRKDDITTRCDTCRALVIVGDEEAHGEWHERLREVTSRGTAGFGGMFANITDGMDKTI